MNFTYENYLDYEGRVPQSGRTILAYQEEDKIVVYQAFRPQIAEYALENQRFGGPHYSFTRMSWIKPNFLWMMYRSGWAQKEGQEYVLAIWIRKSAFEKYLEEAVFSSYHASGIEDHDSWKSAVEKSSVRLQWDPDHDPHGAKIERRAIQLGLRGEVLERFVNEDILRIDNMTHFVQEQYKFVQANKLDQLLIPKEHVYTPGELAAKAVGLVI